MENSGLQKQGNLSVGSGNGFHHREMGKSCVENTQLRMKNGWKNTKVQKFKTRANYRLPNYRDRKKAKKSQKKTEC